MIFQILLLYALLTTPTSAQDNIVRTLPTIPLQSGKDAPALNAYVRYIKYYEGPINAAAIRDNKPYFQSITSPTINFGIPDGKIFTFVTVKNTSTTPGHWILTTGRGSLKEFVMYDISTNDTHILVDGNNLEQVKENLQAFQAFSTEIILDPGQEKTIAFHFASENSTFFPLKIQTYASFFKDRRANIAMTAAVVMGILVLVMLNSIIYSVTGKNEFLWLGLAEITFIFNILHAEGYITIYLLYDKPLLNIALSDIFRGAFAILMAQFARIFIKTREHFPLMNKILVTLISGGLLVIILQTGLSFLSDDTRAILRTASWIIATTVALFLPFVGILATRRLGSQYFPLVISWSSLGLYILYAAFVFSGIVKGLPFAWHWTGPVGLFEAIFATLALGLHLRKLQTDRIKSQTMLTNSLHEKLEISEHAKQLAEEKAIAVATVHDQSNLLHASGHDSQQVLFALNTVVELANNNPQTTLPQKQLNILRSSVNYLEKIISTTMSQSHTAGEKNGFIALSHFKLSNLAKSLDMIYSPSLKKKGLRFSIDIEENLYLISDKALLTRILSNLVSNSLKFTDKGEINIRAYRLEGQIVIEINDTGIGLSKKHIDQLQSKQTNRFKADTTQDGSGSGFKTAINLAKDLYGEISITSVLSEKTQVKVTLPDCIKSIKSHEYLTEEDMQSELSDYIVIDIDSNQKSMNEKLLRSSQKTEKQIIALSHDSSSTMRGWLSKHTNITLLKPLSNHLRYHPALTK